MAEPTHQVSPDPTTPVLSGVEWIAADRETGVLRLRGDFGRPVAEPLPAPALVLRDDSGELTRRAALNDDAPGVDGWRAAYLVAGALLGGAREKWLEWPDGTRLDLPDVDVSLGDGRTGAPPPQSGAEVFDRAVLAERRAQRAESAQRAQARTAEAAVAALGALEQRVEALTRERDALAAARVQSDDAAAPMVRLVAAPEPGISHSGLLRELDAARAAAREAEDRAQRHHQALGDALKALGRLRVQAAEVRLRMRTQMASASADAVRLAVLERERRGVRGRLHAMRGELEGLRARVAREQALSQKLAAELATQRAAVRRIRSEQDGIAAALAAERRLRARSDEALAAERSEAQARAARVVELEAALDVERGAVHRQERKLRREVEDLGRQLALERTARASAQMQLRVARSSESAARAEAAARVAAQERLRREHERALADVTASRAELAGPGTAGARQSPPSHPSSTPVSRLAELEAELAGTRAALETERSRLRRVALAADGDPAASATARPSADYAALSPPAPSALPPGVAAHLRERIAGLQARADGARADSSPGAPRPGDIAARLDAAAASLRGAQRAEAPPATAAGSSPPSPSDASPTSLALTVRPVAAVVSSAAETVAPTTTVAVPAAPAGVPRLGPLRAALVALAVADPFAAARLLAALLPAQGAFLREDIDYDLTIRELGTFAVTVAEGRTSVRLLARPRRRREAQMHLTAHALTLAELLAGRPRRVGRVLAPVKLKGSRRGLEILAALAEARPTLAEVARAGAALEPALLVRALPHLIGAADTQGQRFTVAQELVDGTTRTWYLTADGLRGLTVAESAPEGGADARVTMSRETFDRLLRAEPLDRAHKPWVRGDFAAVETLRRWIDAARG